MSEKPALFNETHKNTVFGFNGWGNLANRPNPITIHDSENTIKINGRISVLYRFPYKKGIYPNLLGNMPHLDHMALVIVGKQISHLKS